MTNAEILKKAIEKAVEGGYVLPYGISHYGVMEWEYDINEKANNNYIVIFSHDFAKAFFGEGYYRYGDTGLVKTSEHSHDRTVLMSTEKEWEYHLQQMVLEEDPLKYLEKFLGEND